jgi:hypothetical protein
MRRQDEDVIFVVYLIADKNTFVKLYKCVQFASDLCMVRLLPHTPRTPGFASIFNYIKVSSLYSLKKGKMLVPTLLQ